MFYSNTFWKGEKSDDEIFICKVRRFEAFENAEAGKIWVFYRAWYITIMLLLLHFPLLQRLNVSKKQIKYDWSSSSSKIKNVHTHRVYDSLWVLDHEILESKNLGLTVNCSQRRVFQCSISWTKAIGPFYCIVFVCVSHPIYGRCSHLFISRMHEYRYILLNSCILNWFSIRFSLFCLWITTLKLCDHHGL